MASISTTASTYTGTSLRYYIPSDAQVGKYMVIDPATIESPMYYYVPTAPNASSHAPHPLCAVLDKDYQCIQQILDNKGSVVL